MAEHQVHAVVFKDAGSDQRVALCLEYDVVTQGDDEQHAAAMLKEAVELYLADLEAGEREALYQSVEGEPRPHTLTVRAPSLLHT